MTALNIDANNLRYKTMLGVGGIGSGQFFLLNGDHTLGREESRGGHFSDRRDYCKLHIIAHYVQTLLGPVFPVKPIGKVGDDDVGTKLLEEMKTVGMSLDYVERSPGRPTLFSFCFIYPDGSGGNMTTDDSACSAVDASFIATAQPEFERFAGQGIALAAPEVPLEARDHMLRMATAHDFFRAASFTSEEMAPALAAGMFRNMDLLAVNLDEAAAAVNRSPEDYAPQSIVEAAIKTLCEINPELYISITYGKAGSWSWDGSTLHHVPAYQAEVESTAGAGDAHLAGMIVGLTVGLSLPEAQQLGTLAGSLSVTSPHTIHKEVDRNSLRLLAEKSGAVLGENITNLLKDRS